MGTFAGHALPGSFFIAFACWWIIQAFIRYYRSLRPGSPPFQSTVTYNCGCRCGKLGSWQWEGFLKVFATVVGGALEIYTAHEGGKFVHLGNGQHATMFFFFGMSGIIDIMMHHKLPLPRDTDYVIVVLALSVEGLLFKFHLHGRDHLDTTIHTLLLFAIYSSVVAVLLEMRFRNSILATLTRCFCIMLQGTWFWQVGFILYPHHIIPGARRWSPDLHQNILVATLAFCWHAAVIFIFIIATGAIIGAIFRYRHGDLHERTDSAAYMNLIKRNGHSTAATTTALNDDESDDDFTPRHT